LGIRFLVRHRIVSAVKRVDFVRDRVSYIVLRGRWCDINALNIHAPRDGIGADKKTVLWGFRSDFVSFSQIPFENYIRRF